MTFQETLSRISRRVAGPASILYLGSNSGTSRHRAVALERLGQQVKAVDPFSFLPSHRLVDYWNHHTGAAGVHALVARGVRKAIGSQQFDVVWVDSGNLISVELLCQLKRQATFVLNYNVDDPFGWRDSRKWRLFLEAVPSYDLLAVVRDCNVDEAYRHGANYVLRVHRSADEVAHAPRPASAIDVQKWESEVAFIGTWMPERGPFLARLLELGVPLSLWGDRWHKSHEWTQLHASWRGPGLYAEADYASAVQSAKVCIGMLSKGNRDLCTQRSFEIPNLGGVLCAERTSEHTALYQAESEAVFWGDADECAAKCKALLADEAWRQQVARRGHFRHLRNGTTNEVVLRQILTKAQERIALKHPPAESVDAKTSAGQLSLEKTSAAVLSH